VSDGKAYPSLGTLALTTNIGLNQGILTEGNTVDLLVLSVLGQLFLIFKIYLIFIKQGILMRRSIIQGSLVKLMMLEKKENTL